MKKVAIGIEINNNAGRGVLGGILKYISGRGDWNIKLMSYPETMSAAVIRNAKANGFNGILVNHTGDAATALELTRTPLPLSVVDIHDKDIRRRQKRTAFSEKASLARAIPQIRLRRASRSTSLVRRPQGWLLRRAGAARPHGKDPSSRRYPTGACDPAKALGRHDRLGLQGH